MLEKVKKSVPQGRLRELLDLLITFAVTAAVVLVLFKGVFMLNSIPSGSMENTIMTGDLLIATRFNKTDVDRYDIMVFIPPDDTDELYIKRVMGLPGETIVVKEGEVYADGVLLDRSFIPEEQTTTLDGTFQVPEGCYFVMGDNRNHSSDSRYWEHKYVPLENMQAKAWFTVWPPSSIKNLHYSPPDGEERP